MHATAAGLLVDGSTSPGAGRPRRCSTPSPPGSRARPGALIWGHGWQDLGWAVTPARAALDRAAGGLRPCTSAGSTSTPRSCRRRCSSARRGGRRRGLVGRPAVGRRPPPRAAGRAGRRRPHHPGRGPAGFSARGPAVGIGVVHECAGPDISSVDDLAALVARSRADPRAPRRRALLGRGRDHRGRGPRAARRHRRARPGGRPVRRRLARIPHRRPAPAPTPTRPAATAIPTSTPSGRRARRRVHGGRGASRVPRDRRRRRGTLADGLRRAARHDLARRGQGEGTSGRAPGDGRRGGRW